MSPENNRALAACAAFRGDVLIVESEHDSMVPHPVIQNYMAACAQAQSLTYRMISGADHALSEKAWQQTYTSLLVNWMSEMVLGARAGKTGTGPPRLRRTRTHGPSDSRSFEPSSTTALFGSLRKSAAALALWCICANSFSRQGAMPLPMVGMTVSRDRK